MLAHYHHGVPVVSRFDERVPRPAVEDVRHVVGTAGPAEGDSHGSWRPTSYYVLLDSVMRELGRIVRLQIQRSSLKTGEKPRRSYDPAPLLAVDRVALGPDGVLGEEPGGGAWLVDVHHRAHPETKNEDGVHGVSLGFTSHYGLMRERFGARITLGCAGENIIVETTGRIAVEDLYAGVALLAPDGRELVRLDVLKEQLQFLDGGTRGYYCRGVGSGIVSIGDRVALFDG